MHHNNEAELDLTALTAEELEILCALRDPEKAERLFALLTFHNCPHDGLVSLSCLRAVPK